MPLNFLRKQEPSSSDWQCHKCKKVNAPREKCSNCHKKFNKDKDTEIKSENTSPTNGTEQKLKHIKKYCKHHTEEAYSDGRQTDAAHCVVLPGPVDRNDGWTCKVCYISGNKERECKMCKQEKKDSYDEENIKNRRKRKTLNRSKLHAGRSIKVDKERDRQIKIAEDIARNITNYCKENKIHYEDKSFPDPTAPLSDEEQWRRIRDVQDKSCKGSKPWTVLNNPSPDDAIQGSAENCWFLCSVSLLAQKRNLVEDIIISRHFSEEGLYQVRLCKDGNWKTVIVDDRFPCDRNGNLKYCRPQNKQLWVMLLEKAAAKLHGGYQALNAGLVVESLALLTGEPCEHINITGSDFEKKDDKKCKVDSEELWANLKTWNQSRYLLGISTPPDNDHEELEDSHCYPILAVEDAHDGKKLVKLWTSSDHQHCVTGCLRSNPSLQKDKKRLLRNLKKGEFWISFEEEFMRYFNYLSVCKIEEGWYESRFKGVFPPVLNDEWKYYSFRLFNDNITKLKLGLFQKSMRGLVERIESFTDLLIVVLRNQEDKLGHPFKQEPLFSRVMAFSNRRARSLTTCNVDLSPGSYTVACFSFGKLQQDNGDFNDNDYVKYTLSIHSSQPLNVIDEINAGKFPQLRFAPADALITLAKQSKMKEDTNSQNTGIRISQINRDVYCAMFMFYGEICVFINETTEGYVYNRDYGKSSYLMAVRRSLSTSDFIPPKSGRVINIVTPMNPETQWEVAAQKGSNPCHSPKASYPAIPDTLKALLTTRTIPEITPT